MTREPQVRAVRRDGERVEFDLFVPRSLEFFPDHFPAFGILPGVVQLDWAIAFGRQHLGIDGAFRGLRALKFQHPILPDTAVTLELSRAAPGELLFSYRSGNRCCSAGRALFEPGNGV